MAQTSHRLEKAQEKELQKVFEKITMAQTSHRRQVIEVPLSYDAIEHILKDAEIEFTLLERNATHALYSISSQWQPTDLDFEEVPDFADEIPDPEVLKEIEERKKKEWGINLRKRRGIVKFNPKSLKGILKIC